MTPSKPPLPIYSGGTVNLQVIIDQVLSWFPAHGTDILKAQSGSSLNFALDSVKVQSSDFDENTMSSDWDFSIKSFHWKNTHITVPARTITISPQYYVTMWFLSNTK